MKDTQSSLHFHIHTLRRALAAHEGLREQLISIDTFHGAVARKAVAAGAHIVNDVSGGSLDPSMHSVVRLIRDLPSTYLSLLVATIPAYAAHTKLGSLTACFDCKSTAAHAFRSTPIPATAARRCAHESSPLRGRWQSWARRMC